MQKIRLTTNTNIGIPEHLTSIDTKYGFSYYSDNNIENITSENSFGAKLLSKLDKIWGKFKPVSEEDQKIVDIIAERTSFLSSHASKESTEDLKIQLNFNTDFNKKLNELSEIFTYEPSLHSKIKESINDNVGYIYTKDKSIFLGLEMFKSDTPLMATVRENCSLEDFISSTLFHEFSHSLEIHNKKTYGWNFNTLVDFNLAKTSSFQNDNNLYSLNKHVKSSFPDGDFEPLDPDLISNLRCLPKEIYADVGGILLQRNYDLIHNQYSLDRSKNLTSAIDSGRKNEMLNLINDDTKHYRTEFYIQQVNHFTSPGLDYLKEELNKYPERVLSEEEIHNISQQCVRVGMARTLYTLINANNNLVPQFKTLFSLINNSEFSNSINDMMYSVSPLIVDTTKNNYKEMVDDILKLVGDDWLKKFNADSDDIYKNIGIQDKSKAIFHAALIPEEFERTLIKANKLNAELDDLFGSSTPKQPLDIEQAKTTQFDNKTLYSNNIQSVLAKMRNSDNNNINKLKM